MPFTFAHPAIILPLAKSRYRPSLTGLVAGSMVPDFEFFLTMKAGENTGHHLPGFFVFDIPAAILICFVYHNIVRDMLINNLPLPLKARLIKYTGFNWNAYALQHKGLLLASIITGVASHLFWDAFTHYDGLFVTIFPLLAKKLVMAGNTVAVYSLLQVACSIGGLWVILRMIAKIPAVPFNQFHTTKQPVFWLLWITTATIIFAARISTCTSYQGFWDIFMAAMGSTIYALPGISLLLKNFQFINRHVQQQ
jgi:Domain of unknown function (DUF4184)